MMRLNQELVTYIDNILSKYFEDEEKVEMLTECYVAVISSLDNPNIRNYWAYVRGVIMNTINPILKEQLEKAYLDRKES